MSGRVRSYGKDIIGMGRQDYKHIIMGIGDWKQNNGKVGGRER